MDTHSPLAWSIALHCHYQEGCTDLAQAIQPKALGVPYLSQGVAQVWDHNKPQINLQKNRENMH